MQPIGNDLSLLTRLFDRHVRLVDELRRRGRAAPAEVIGAQETNTRYGPAGTAREFLWRVRVQVRPEAGTEFEAVIKQRFPYRSRPQVGGRLGVLYDPNKLERVVVDETVAGTGSDGAPPPAGNAGGIPAEPIQRDDVGTTIDIRNG